MDNDYVSKGMAADVLERMSWEDFLELCADMKNAVVLEEGLDLWVAKVNRKQKDRHPATGEELDIVN